MADLTYENILIRYGELTTKGKNKKDFIRRLAENLRQALSAYPDLTFEQTRDHIYIHLHGTDPTKVTPILKDVFGIRSFACSLKVDNDIDAIKEACRQVMADKSGTFKIAARRANKSFPLHSDDINRQVATVILKNYGEKLKVDVHDPDYEVIVEVREHNTYIMYETILGAGGYPVGVGGKALLMLSGGIDSPVAGYLTMKRGVQIEAIHYASMPYTSQEALNKVKELTRLISGYQGQIWLHVIPFTDIQLQIYKYADESYAITLMRRMMYRLAEMVSEKKKCLAIVNGESIGQVASQTLDSMNAINCVVTMPVIRPLVAYDKLEIIELARKIGTYETSILPYEDCCTIFDPKDPVTKPRRDKCERYESRFDWQPMLEKAVENMETIVINPSSRFDEADDIL
ncbi:MAG: tRNA 4-thiouridine(8) synthase ThiI [Erysipelotrichaceae bacterium]|nr:tRNA 4-thiouridine(8) synthase ThiI [Erysipelotrichaceae bacterium]